MKYFIGVFFLQFLIWGAGAVAWAKPVRVVSMSLCSDEMVLRLVDKPNIAAVTKSALVPYISSVTEQARDLRTIIGTVEEILMLNPDLILAGAYTDPQKITLLKRLGFRVKMLKSPKDFNELKALVREVGQMVGEPSRAEALIREMERRLKRLEAVPSTNIEAVFYWPGARVAGVETMIHSIMETAGVHNIAARLGMRYYDVLSLEHLVMNNPALIIMSDYKTEVPTLLRDILSHPVITKGFSGFKTMYLPSEYILCGSPANITAAEILSEYVRKHFK